MFTSICEIILGALIRARIVRNEGNLFFLDLRTLNDRNLSTKNGVFLAADEMKSVFEIMFTPPTSIGSFTQHIIGSKKKLLLIKHDADGSLTILLAKKPDEFEITGLRLAQEEVENLRQQQNYLVQTIEDQQSRLPPLPPKKRYVPQEGDQVFQIGRKQAKK